MAELWRRREELDQYLMLCFSRIEEGNVVCFTLMGETGLAFYSSPGF